MTVEEALQRCVDAATVSPVQAYLGAGVRVAARTAIIVPIDLWEDLVRAIDEAAVSTSGIGDTLGA